MDRSRLLPLVALTLVGFSLHAAPCAPAPGLGATSSQALAWGVRYDRAGAVHVVSVDLTRAALVPGYHPASTAARLLGSANATPFDPRNQRVFATINGGLFDPATKGNVAWGLLSGGLVEPDRNLRFSPQQLYRIAIRSLLVMGKDASGAATAFVLSPQRWFLARALAPDAAQVGTILTDELNNARAAGWQILAIQGGGRLLPFDRDSSSYNRGRADDWRNPDPGWNGRTSRTAVGMNGPCAFLVAVDKPGVTIPDLARLIGSLGATEAVAFDGGGSTQMAISGTSDPRDVVEVSTNDSPTRTVPSSIAAFAWPTSIEIAAAVPALHAAKNDVFLDRTVRVMIPPGVTVVRFAGNRDGTASFGVDDFAVVDVTDPWGATRQARINANDAHNRPVGEQSILSNVIPFAPGIHTIQVRLVNEFAPAGLNASSSPVWLIIE